MEKEPNLNQSSSESHTQWDTLSGENFKNERYERMELGNELYERIQNNAKIKKTFAIVALTAAIGAGIFNLGAHTYKSRTVKPEVRNTWEAEDFGLTEDDLGQFHHTDGHKGHSPEDPPMPDPVPPSSTLSPDDIPVPPDPDPIPPESDYSLDPPTPYDSDPTPASGPTSVSRNQAPDPKPVSANLLDPDSPDFVPPTPPPEPTYPYEMTPDPDTSHRHNIDHTPPVPSDPPMPNPVPPGYNYPADSSDGPNPLPPSGAGGPDPIG